MSAIDALTSSDRAVWLTDGGLETTLIFHDGLDLPDFAAFTLLDSDHGRDALERYYRSYIAIARRHGTGLVLETPTWRASADWGRRLGYDEAALQAVNASSVAMLRVMRAVEPAPATPILISGNVGPRRDGYVADALMSADEAEAYHAAQIRTLHDSSVDLITALTITTVDEAIGIVRAAVRAGAPVVISFTVELDGTLPSGQRLVDAITELDAATDSAAAYVMVNCAHPDHLAAALAPSHPALVRLRGLRANASRRSHAELDEAEDLDDGDPAELASLYAGLLEALPDLVVVGGCCGTDSRHIEAIAERCAPLARGRSGAGGQRSV
ncbi:MAG: homocysteine S-methyltransferase family protein [Microcella sp.]